MTPVIYETKRRKHQTSETLKFNTSIETNSVKNYKTKRIKRLE